jgi:hypothetical protein
MTKRVVKANVYAWRSANTVTGYPKMQQGANHSFL